MYNPNSIYQILGKIHHKSLVFGFGLLKEKNLHPGQMPLLGNLWKEEGQSQRALASKLGIKPSTINVMIGRLEKNGIIYKTQDPTDQRKSLVYLTEEGKNLQEDIKQKMDEVRDEVMKSFTEEEKNELVRLLNKFDTCLNEQLERQQLRKDGKDA
jgi:DNA-binding MarR family transcriptional regulator